MDPVSRMASRLNVRLAAACFVCFSSVQIGLAQLPQTRLQAVFPTGGRAGTEFDVKVTSGADLDELAGLTFSHPGITATQKMSESGDKQVPVDSTFVVKIAPDVPVGLYECRARGLFGESNPRRFRVTAEPTIVETEANNNMDQATAVELGTVVHGTLGGAADLDFFRFDGTAGQSIVVRTEAATLDSQMVVAAELLDASGRRLKYVRNRYGEDPVLAAQLPSDGAYFVKLYDFTYRNGNDYFYQLLISDRPHIVAVDPPVAVPGTTNKLTLLGYNLTGGQPADLDGLWNDLQQLTVDVQVPQNDGQLPSVLPVGPVQSELEGFVYRWESPQGPSNQILIPFVHQQPAREAEPNDESTAVQKLDLPAELIGTFGRRGDVDTFDFEATAGEVLIIEVYGQRLGSAADPYFVLDQVQRDKDGNETGLKRLTAQDDIATNLGGNDFNTQSDDAQYRLTVPQDGTYRLAVRDRYFESRGGPSLYYRLSIRHETPDFQVIAFSAQSPAAANQPSQLGAAVVRRGGTVDLRVLIFRQDGFDGAVRVKLTNPPAGVAAAPIVIGTGAVSGTIVIQAREDAEVGDSDLVFEADAVIDDPQLVRQQVAAEKAVEPIAKQLQTSQESLAKLVVVRDQAAEKLAVAEAALRESPEDEGRKKAVEQAQAVLKPAQEKVDAATKERDEQAQKLSTVEQAFKAATAAVQQARHSKTRPVRAATLVWPVNGTDPAIARLTGRIRLSVMEELAPFHVDLGLENNEITVHQGRQLLIPVNLVKRSAFDENVSLTWNDVDKNSKVAAENKTVNKGSSSETLKVAVDQTAPEGDYTIYLRAQGQVPYSRNPARVDRAKATFEEASRLADVAAENLKTRTAERDESKKQLATVDAALKSNEALLKQQQATAQQAMATLAAATKSVGTAKTNVENSIAASKSAAEQLTSAEESLAKDAENPQLQKAKADAMALVASTKVALEAAEKAHAEALKVEQQAKVDLQKAEDAVKESTLKDVELKKQLADVQELLKNREELVKAADSSSKQTTADKAAADKELKAAEAAAKPKNVNYFPAAVPVVLHVRPAPLTLAAAVPDGGNLKPGAALEIKVTVKRSAGFTEPIQLSLVHGGELKGVTASSEGIPTGATEGVITLTATADAGEAAIPYAAIRATTGSAGEVIVDVPVNVKVTK